MTACFMNFLVLFYYNACFMVAFIASQISCRLSDLEEAVREKTRMVSMLQVRTKFLEEENSRLQDRIDSITKQKQGLDKLVKDYKLSGKDREVQVGSPEPVHHSCPLPWLC